jgi:hypothetical protein
MACLPYHHYKHADDRDRPDTVKIILQVKEPDRIEDSPAVRFARQGGLKGGSARAATLTAERRREIARLAAKRRWSKTVASKSHYEEIAHNYLAMPRQELLYSTCVMARG